MNNLLYAMREVAHLYAAQKIDIPVIEVFTRFMDGLDIPASTQVVVTVRMEHIPDAEVTPELEMEEVMS